MMMIPLFGAVHDGQLHLSSFSKFPALLVIMVLMVMTKSIIADDAKVNVWPMAKLAHKPTFDYIDHVNLNMGINPRSVENYDKNVDQIQTMSRALPVDTDNNDIANDKVRFRREENILDDDKVLASFPIQNDDDRNVIRSRSGYYTDYTDYYTDYDDYKYLHNNDKSQVHSQENKEWNINVRNALNEAQMEFDKEMQNGVDEGLHSVYALDNDNNKQQFVQPKKEQVLQRNVEEDGVFAEQKDHNIQLHKRRTNSSMGGGWKYVTFAVAGVLALAVIGFVTLVIIEVVAKYGETSDEGAANTCHQQQQWSQDQSDDLPSTKKKRVTKQSMGTESLKTVTSV